MPIVGNLSEFPLPEVLILIGLRTGRLRLLDVPEFGVLDIDIANGDVQAMHVGGDKVTETRTMLDKLGTIMQTQNGMFEFRLSHVPLVARSHSLTIHDLVMRLVCHVDEQRARQKAVPAVGQRYRLVLPEPEIWLDPELDQFFHAARFLLASGVTLADLSRHLQMEATLVHQNLINLRLLGLIDLAHEETSLREEDVCKSKALFRVARMTDTMRKLSTRVPAA